MRPSAVGATAAASVAVLVPAPPVQQTAAAGWWRTSRTCRRLHSSPATSTSQVAAPELLDPHEPVHEVALVPREHWSPPKDHVDHAAEQQEKFRRAAIEHEEKRPLPVMAEEPSTPQPSIYVGASDEIVNMANRATTDQADNRAGRFFDPKEGPRESMAVGRRPSVKEMMRNRQGGMF